MKIFITTQFEAYHSWNEAPEEVGFLKNLHRHIFKVKATWLVNHDNRDLEFFIQKRKVDKFIVEHFAEKQLVNMSCEQMASMIKQQFDAIEVEVSEDGENGAIV